MDLDDLFELMSHSESIDTCSLLPSWIKEGSNATLFLSTMSKPHNGKLFSDSHCDWIFCPGNSLDVSKGIKLPDLSTNCQNLLYWPIILGSCQV